MNSEVYTIVDGVKQIDVYKLTGGGYERAWFTNCKVRYRAFVGARNTKKSYNIIGLEVIFKILSDDRRNVVICRKNDVDNRQSTFANIVSKLDDLGLLGTEFKTCSSPLEITYVRTNQKIMFRGLNNTTSLTSIDVPHGKITDVYIEEAFELDSYSDFRKLDGSLRLPKEYTQSGLKPQITVCFNGWDGESWLNTLFFKGNLEDDYDLLDNPKIRYLDYYDPEWNGPFGKGLYLHKSTYKINEFRDEEWDLAAQNRKLKDPEGYKVEFLGMFGTTTGKVYTNFKQEELVIPIQKIIGTDQYGRPNMEFIQYEIGVDTGLSDGEGKVKAVKKGESQDIKIKAATTMSLSAMTSDYKKLVTIDEYFHSNNEQDNDVNTDNTEKYTEPEQARACAVQIKKWIDEFETLPSMLMKGEIPISVDSADIGFKETLEMELRRLGIDNIKLKTSTKRPIRLRISFTNLLMAYGEFLICDRCKNLIREIKNCRKGEGNKARMDGNDHIINADEYAKANMYEKLRRWRDYKPH